MTRLLLVVALPHENADNLLSAHGHELLYTGVGKVNATLALTRALAARDHDGLIVINLGSAGSRTFPAGQVVQAQRFFERDMDASAIGFPLGLTPFETDDHIDSSLLLPGLPGATCYTGDSFVTTPHPKLDLALIDMEAYALAKVCQSFGLPFASLKFVTDGADGAAASDWDAAVHLSAERLSGALTLVEQHLGLPAARASLPATAD